MVDEEIKKEDIETVKSMMQEKKTEIKEEVKEPNYLEQLAEKKKELLEIEERLDKKKKEILKTAEDSLMAGRSLAGQSPKEKPAEEIQKEKINKILEGTGLKF